MPPFILSLLIFQITQHRPLSFYTAAYQSEAAQARQPAATLPKVNYTVDMHSLRIAGSNWQNRTVVNLQQNLPYGHVKASMFMMQALAIQCLHSID
eukprot:scaffold487853_cov52-Prasinocladus_malaysianus.AAC.2